MEIKIEPLILPDCDNIFISTSFGRTSMMMLKIMKEHPRWRNKNLFAAFSNTGKEREETLIFGERCAREFNFPITWIEAVITPEKGIGSAYKFVDYDTASRNGEPFLAAIQKYGIPYSGAPWCSENLKEVPLTKLARDYFNGEPFVSAIGMRFDEFSRVKKRDKVIYPMAALGLVKRDVRKFWSEQSFDLQLKDYEGNCDLCFKKSKRNLLTIIAQDPKRADWWNQAEIAYGDTNNREALFTRGGKTTMQELIDEALAGNFVPMTDPWWQRSASKEMDESESCNCQNQKEFNL